MRRFRLSPAGVVAAADKTLVRFDFHYASNDSSGDTGFCLVDGTLTSG